jgi:hypothetical protein
MLTKNLDQFYQKNISFTDLYNTFLIKTLQHSYEN